MFAQAMLSEDPELKFISGKSKGRGPVAVGGVPVEFGQHAGAKLHLGMRGAFIWSVGFDRFQNRVQLVAEEDRYDGGRRFVGAEPVIVSGCCNRDAKKVLIIVYRLDNGA